MGDNNHSRIFERDCLPAASSFVWTFLTVIHLIEPITGRRESSSVEDHSNGKVGIMNIEVEWNTPHDNQSSIKMFNLPADCTTCSSGSSTLLVANHYFSRGWLYVLGAIFFHN